VNINWIGYSLVVFLGIAAFTVAARKAKSVGVLDRQIQILAIILPLCGSLAFGLVFARFDTLTLTDLIETIALAIILGYLSGRFVVSGVVSDVDRLLVTTSSKIYGLAAVLIAGTFMGAAVGWRQGLASFIITAGALMVIFEGVSFKLALSRRTFLVVAVAVGAPLLTTLVARALFDGGLKVAPFLVCYNAALLACLLIHDQLDLRTAFKGIERGQWFWLLIASLAAAVFVAAQFAAIAIAPNPGYAGVAEAAAVGFVAVIDVFAFKDGLTLRRAIGVFMLTIGLGLLLS